MTTLAGLSCTKLRPAVDSFQQAQRAAADMPASATGGACVSLLTGCTPVHVM